MSIQSEGGRHEDFTYISTERLGEVAARRDHGRIGVYWAGFSIPSSDSSLSQAWDDLIVLHWQAGG